MHMQLDEYSLSTGQTGLVVSLGCFPLCAQVEGAHADTASRQSGDAERTVSREDEGKRNKTVVGAVEQSAESQPQPSLEDMRQV